MKKNIIKQINPIQKRANAKPVTIANRYFVIAGISQSHYQSNDINQFKFTKNNNQYKIQWKPYKLKNTNIFTPRNSFAACGSKQKIYIYGGIATTQTGPKTLKDFIEINLQSNKAMNVQQKGQLPPALNSATLNYYQKQNCLFLFGGTNDNNDINHDIFKFEIDNGQWIRVKLQLINYKEAIWQHTALLVEKPFEINNSLIINSNKQINQNKIIKLDLGFTQEHQPDLKNIKKVNLTQQLQITEKMENLQIQQIKNQNKTQKDYKGPFLIVIGGCGNPQYPYSFMTQIDIGSQKVISQISLIPMVGHDSIIFKDNIYIFGGSDGCNQIDSITIFGKELRKQKGLLSIGGLSFSTGEQLIIYGGINMQSQSFNGFTIYS